MNLKKYFLLSICLILSFSFAKAQQVDLEITPICQPNCSPFIYQWQSDPTICSAIINSNLPNPMQVLIQVVLVENSIGEIAFAESEPFELPQGPNQLEINNTNYFNYQELEYAPEYEDIILTTGTLPEGSYEICYLFINAQDGNPLGQNCTQFDILFPDPSQLISPGNANTPFDTESTNYPNFQYSPINWSESPVEYYSKIVELLENQTPQEAVEINPAHHEMVLIDEYQFQYPEDAFPLESGNTYCWNVSTYNPEGFPISGTSETFCYEYNDTIRNVGNDPPGIPLNPGIDSIPNTFPIECLISPKVIAAPAMTGGCATTSTQIIEQDEFLVLQAFGEDKDALVWECLPDDYCPDTPSKRFTKISGRVKWMWRIASGEGNFVEIGCLPATDYAIGQRVIFEPPYVKVGAEETTYIDLITQDDIPGRAKDPDLTSKIKITIKRFLIDSNKYHVSIKPTNKSNNSTLPEEVIGTCIGTGPDWKDDSALTKPKIILPNVADNDKLAFNELLLLKVDELRETDLVIVGCQSEICTGSTEKISLEDEIQYEWKIVSGGGRFIKSFKGTHVVYEAPSSGKEVKIEVKAFNPGGQFKDKEQTSEKLILKLYEPGIFLKRTKEDWIPELDNKASVVGWQASRPSGTEYWKPPLAHMCCIPKFELVERSSEPGVAINWDDPDRNREKRPDLLFHEKDNKDDYDLFKAPRAFPEYYSLITKKKKIVGKEEPEPIIFCEDWGAYGKLELTARNYTKIEEEKDKKPRNSTV